MRYCRSLMLLCFILISPPTYSASKSFSNLTALEKNGVTFSAEVYNLKTGKLLSSFQEDKKLIPASTTKIIVGAKALEMWGPGKTFNSALYCRGYISGSVLHGDLVFLGNGDPSLTNEKLWSLTSDVARLGIKTIKGKIIVNNSLFGYLSKGIDREKAELYSHNAYNSPLSSAAVNFSVVGVVIFPGEKIGKKATVSIEPYELNNIKILNNVRTTSKLTNKIFVTRQTKNGTDIFNVTGEIAKNSEPVRIYRSISDPDNYTGEVIKAFLEHNDIRASGKILVEDTPLKTTDFLISQVEGYPLSWQLNGLFAMSNNFIADMLTMDIGITNAIAKNNNLLRNSSKILENYVNNFAQNPNHTQPAIIDSGSGLTPENKLSARDLVNVLNKMYYQYNLFPNFLAAFASPGEEGSLKKRFSQLNMSQFPIDIHAKTGTLSDPVPVVALAGYSRVKNGDWIAFAIIVNGTHQNSQVGIEELRLALDSDLVEILEKE